MRLNELSKTLRLAGDQSRLEILCVIFSKNNFCVSDIAKELNLSVAIVSHHLKVMSKDKLLNSKRDGKKICYELSKDPLVADLKKFICKYK